MEARVSPDEPVRIERAASAAGESVSAFLVGDAVRLSGEVIAEATTTTVPADYFDELLAALDVAGPAPQLTEAAKRGNRTPRIAPRKLRVSKAEIP